MRKRRPMRTPVIDGEQINLGSPKQLQSCFDKPGMPEDTRRTKTGYTTDADALNDLFAKTEHPFPRPCCATATRRACGA